VLEFVGECETQGKGIDSDSTPRLGRNVLQLTGNAWGCEDANLIIDNGIEVQPSARGTQLQVRVCESTSVEIVAARSQTNHRAVPGKCVGRFKNYFNSR